MSSLPNDPAEALLARFLGSRSARDSMDFAAWAAEQPELAGHAALRAEVERLVSDRERERRSMGFFGRGGSRKDSTCGAGDSAGVTFAPGQRIAQFELRRFLAQGGMGEV